MYIFWFVVVILICLYYFRIGGFFYGWLKTSAWSLNNENIDIRLSVVVPVRNEEANISLLMDDLVNQDYPSDHFEIIIIDDHSSDQTPIIAQKFIKKRHNIRFFKLSGSGKGKKAALHRGIMTSRNQFILTTDADCRLSPSWVKTMADCFHETKSDLIAGPVLMQGGKSFFCKFQILEYLSLQGSTAGAITTGNPVMCSSANLGFRKDSYLEVKEDLNDQISSGDDVFLLHALHNSGDKKIYYIKSFSSAVLTSVQPDIKSFINQRIRWASKSRHYNSKTSIYTALLIFLINSYAVICIIAGLFIPQLFFIAGFIFIFKSIIDFLFLNSVARFFKQEKLMIYFPVIQVVYFFYVSFIAIVSFVGNFEWKGRDVKN